MILSSKTHIWPSTKLYKSQIYLDHSEAKGLLTNELLCNLMFRSQILSRAELFSVRKKFCIINIQKGGFFYGVRNDYAQTKIRAFCLIFWVPVTYLLWK